MDMATAIRSFQLRRRVLCAAIWIAITAAVAVITSPAIAQPVDSLRVMSYNILGGGNQTGPLSRTVDVIEAAQADVIGIQEASASADDIAAALGFNYHSFNADLAIVSRYPITQVLTGGIKIQLSPGQEVYLFNAHLIAYPYQPYLLRPGEPGGITTESQAIASAQSTRGMQLSSFLNNFMSAPLSSGLPVFFVGDFNEPSHLDWTQEAADEGLNFGMKVDWPASNAVANKGLIDAFRELRPDEINDRGETWTPGYAGMPANEVHDRIDFVYYRPAGVAPISAQLLGYDINDGNTDIGLQPYPSDHRALVVEFDLVALPGDYNRNGVVDAADYTVWRDTFGTTVTALDGADGSGNGLIDQADYDAWVANFGDVLNPGSAAAALVPEPTPILLLAIAFGIGASIQTGAVRRLTSSASAGSAPALFENLSTK